MIVTIGLPFFNAEKTLELTLSSIVKQTYSEFELLLIDDCSTDRSNEIATKYLCDPRVKLFKNEYNLGLSASLNKIINLSKHEIIVRMDADDVMFPNRVESIVQEFINNQDCNIIGHSAIVIDEDDEIIGIRNTPKHTSLVDCYLKTRFIHPSVAYRKHLVENIHYDSSFDGCEDVELWFRLFPYSKVILIDEPLIYYRETKRIKIKTYMQRNKKLIRFHKKYKNVVALKLFYRAMITDYIRILVSGIINILGIDWILLRKRNQILRLDELVDYKAILEKIKCF